MAEDVIDSLSVQINSNSQNAASAIDDVCRKFEKLNTAVSSIGTKGLRNYAKGFGEVAAGLRALNSIDSSNLSRTVTALQQLSKIDLSGLENKKIKVDIELNNADMSSRLKYALDKSIDETEVDASKLAARLIDSFNLKGGAAAKLRAQMNELAKQLTGSFDGTDFSANSDVMRILDEMGNSILKSGSVVKANLGDYLNGVEQEWQDFYDYFKNKKLYVSEMLKFDVGRGEFKELLQQHLGNITVDPTKGIDVNASWSNLHEMFRTLIPEETTNAADQLVTILKNLAEVREKIKPISIQELVGKDAEQATDRVWTEVVSSTDQIGDSIKKNVGSALESAKGEIPIEVKINEDKIVRDIRNAINKAAETKFNPINIELSINSEAIKNSIAEKFANIDTGNIPAVAEAMQKISDAVNSIGNINLKDTGINAFINSINRLTTALQTDFDTTKLDELIKSLGAIGSIPDVSTGVNRFVSSIARLANAGNNTGVTATQLPQLGTAISNLATTVSASNISPQVNSFVQAISSLASAGNKTGQTAAQLGNLGTALKQFFTTMKSAPQLSANTVKMTQALASLANAGNKVGAAANKLGNSFGKISQGTKSGASALSKFGSALNSTNKHANQTNISISNLVAKFWQFKTKVSMLKMAFEGLWKPIEKSMNFLEDFNYFESAFEQVSSKAKNQWSQMGYDSAEAYADSFSERARELTSKMSGYNISDEGLMSENGFGKSLGMDPSMLLNYQAMYSQMSSSMGVASEQALKLSNALTMIGADLASVRNEDFDKVYKNMASGLVGMSRAVDKYGINIRVANLQQKAQALGIDASIQKMSQADKALLRTIVILDSSRYAWADMADTINMPANQVRILHQNLIMLTRSIGNLFLPVVAKVLPYINGITIAFKRLIDFIGSLLGVDTKIKDMVTGIGNGGDILSDALDSVENTDLSGVGADVNDNLKDATSNAKKLNHWLASFDELEVMNQDDSSLSSALKVPGLDTSGLGDYSGILNAALDDILDEYQKRWNAAYNSMDNKAMAFADKVEKSFKKLAAAAKPTTDALVKLWNNGLKQFRNFTWTALKDFWSHFLVPLGKWTLGEEGLPRLINAFDKFLVDIHWDEINAALVNLWDALEPFAENVGAGLLDFFEELLGKSSDLVNLLPDGINSIAEFINGISPETARSIGHGLGELLTAFMAFKGLSWIGSIFSSTGAIGKGFAALAAHPYLGIAAGIGGVVVALDGFGIIDVDWKAIWEKIKKAGDVIKRFAENIDWKTLSTDIGNLWDAFQPFALGFADAFIDFFDIMLNGIGAPAINTLAKAIGWLAEKIASLSPETLEAIGKTLGELIILKGIAGFSKKIIGLAGSLGTLSGSLSGGALSGKIASLTASLKGLAVASAALGSFKLGEWISVNLLGGEKKSTADFIQDNIIGYQKGDLTGAISEWFKDVFGGVESLSADDLQLYQDWEDAIFSLLRAGKVEGDDAHSLLTYMDKLKSGGEDASIAILELKNKMDELGISSELFEQALAGISQPTSDLGNTAQTASDQFSGMADRINGVSFEDIGKQLTDFQLLIQTVNFAQLVTETANAIDEMGGIWRDGKQVLGEEALKIYQEICAGLKPDDNGYYKLADDSMVQFGNGISDNKETLTNTLDETLQGAINGALEGNAEGWALCAELGKNQVEKCGEGITGNVSLLTGNMEEAIKTSGTDSKATAESTGKALGKNIADGLSKGMDGQKEPVKLSILDLMENSVKAPAATAVDSHSPSKWFSNLAKFCGEGFSNGLEPGFRATFNWFGNFRDRISGSIGSLRNIGWNAIIGLNNGVVDASKKLFDNLRSIAESIGNTFRRILKIHSPSRLLEDIGVLSMQGLVNGFEDLVPLLRSTIGGIGGVIQDVPIGDFGKIAQKFPTKPIEVAMKAVPEVQINQKPTTSRSTFGDDIRKEIIAISANTFDNNQNIGAAVKAALSGMAIYAGDNLVGYLKDEDNQHRNRTGFGLFEGV